VYIRKSPLSKRRESKKLKLRPHSIRSQSAGRGLMCIQDIKGLLFDYERFKSSGLELNVIDSFVGHK
jgi:hypothetical protein